MGVVKAVNMNIHDFNKKTRKFVENKCPYQYHFCDGTPIGDENERHYTKPKPPCPYYKHRGFLQSGCTHPERR